MDHTDHNQTEESEEGSPVECSECGILVGTGERFHSTPCGTHCEECMHEHMHECGVCSQQFT